jgi:glycosyltransferase involved in cell wall biosynthesis
VFREESANAGRIWQNRVPVGVRVRVIMRIGFVCFRFFPPDGTVGGIEVFVLTLAQRLKSLGHHPVVVSGERAGSNCPDKDSIGGIPVYRFALPKRKPRVLTDRLRYQRVVEQVVREEELDLVEYFDQDGMLLSKRFGCPLVVRLHQNDFVRREVMGLPRSSLRDGNFFFERRLLKMADALVAVSDWVGKMTLKTAGLEHLGYRVIHNGVDTTMFAPTRDSEVDPDLILFAGQLNDRKGLPTLLEAIQTVMLRYPKARLRCVGAGQKVAGYPSPAEKYLSSLPSPLRSRVDFVGSITHDRMPDEFRRAGLCVFPSRAEGLGIVVVEAMACGAPVVYMKDGVGPEVITHGVDGLLCDTLDPTSLASTILQALSSPDLRRSLGERARQTVLARFSLDKTVPENVSLYEEMIGGQR